MALSSFGYKLSSEEFGARELVRLAQRAEEAGFGFAAISDHYHPWTDEEGHSPFVWGVLGAVARATTTLELLTGVTCPTIRMHPAIVAQAAATAAELSEGRFSLGLGTGEHLNEHILGDRWPAAAERREMLDEAIDVIRELWRGQNTNHEGKHYRVVNARIYSLPDEAPAILIAASGNRAIELAGEKGDGIISLAPDPRMLQRFDEAGGSGKPRYAEVTVCWGQDETRAVETARELWPLVGVPGELSQELPLPRHFEQAGSLVRSDDFTDQVPCGPDPEKHLVAIGKFVEAGYTHVWVHQIGPEQDGFIDFYQREIIPKL